MKITKKIDTKIRRLAKLSAYGLEWVRDNNPDHDMAYITGAVECVGFQIACTLSQSILPNKPGVPTSDVVQDLVLNEFPSEQLLRKRIKRFVRRFEEDENTQ
jgi:hypothetical protein